MYLTLSIAVMAIITYIVRALPIALFKKKIKSRVVKSFLYYVPYAVLSCMTFPTILFSTNNFYAALFASVFALIASFFRFKLIFVVLIAVATAFGFSFIFV